MSRTKRCKAAGAATALAGVAMLIAMALPGAAFATFPWLDQAALRNETDPALRDTYIVDVGSGNTIPRQLFLSHPYIDLYEDHGFDRNFFTWAPSDTVGDGYVSGRAWTGCASVQVAVPDGNTHCATSAVKTGSANQIRVDVLEGNLTGFKWGDVFISNICGNWSPANDATKPPPVPTISGVKYEDLNADGDRDAGEPGLAGWTIDLLYNGSKVASTTTGSGGAYSFALDADSLPIGSGKYEVREVLKSGWHQSDAPGPIAVEYGIGNHKFTGRDFGNWRPAKISGGKFDDSSVDGSWDAEELGLPGWEIGLSNGEKQLTGGDGSYWFSVRPGTYTVAETPQGGWRQTAPASPGTFTHTVISGQEVSGVDFGNVCLGSAAVEPVDDSTGEPLSGLEIRIEEVAVPGILENDPPLPRTTTGTPSFGDLLPGSYRIVAFLPEGVFSIDPDATVVEERFAIVKEITVAECETTHLPLHFVTRSTPGKVTGGQVEIPLAGGHASSGFEFMTRNEDARGTLQFVDHESGLDLHTADIELLYIEGEKAWVWGKVEIAGTLYRFELILTDAGEPGTEDRFELTLDSGYEAGQGQAIGGGNIQIH